MGLVLITQTGLYFLNILAFYVGPSGVSPDNGFSKTCEEKGRNALTALSVYTVT